MTDSPVRHVRGFRVCALHRVWGWAYTLVGMKPLLRTYLSIVLALMLALTGQSMALARGATDPAGQMVLCP